MATLASMPSNMHQQSGIGNETFTTQLAYMLLLAGVKFLMRAQRGHLRETFPAHFAHIRLLAGMRPAMLQQVMPIEEHTFAGIARELARILMLPADMLRESLLFAKSLTAQFARERVPAALFVVRFQVLRESGVRAFAHERARVALQKRLPVYHHVFRAFQQIIPRRNSLLWSGE